MQRLEAAQAETPASSGERVFGRAFFLVWSSAFGTFWCWYLMLPTMPFYVLDLGGSERDVGLLLTFSSLAGIVVRPFAGRWVDQVGPRPVLLAGSVGNLLASLLHLTHPSLVGVFLLRMAIGASWGTFTTGTWTAVSMLAPPHRRAEIMSYYQMGQTLAMAVGPATALVLLDRVDFTFMFALISVCAGVVVVLAKAFRHPGTPVEGPPRPIQYVSRPAAATSVVQACFTLSYSVVIGFLPVYLVSQHVQNPGLFFPIYAGMLLVARTFAGQIADRFGRSAAIVPGLLCGSIGMYLLPYATELGILIVAAIALGTAFAMIGPPLMALTVDRALPQERGAALATIASSFDVGLSIGALLWGVVAERFGFPVMFSAAALAPLVGLAFYLGWARPGVYHQRMADDARREPAA
ncbi:MAG: MFS transporter [Chloroflexi bacterium]|nr:MFS transporter [Chloroflexota bacterium]